MIVFKKAQSTRKIDDVNWSGKEADCDTMGERMNLGVETWLI